MKKKEATFLENLCSSLPAVKNGVAMVEGEATMEYILVLPASKERLKPWSLPPAFIPSLGKLLTLLIPLIKWGTFKR